MNNLIVRKECSLGLIYKIITVFFFYYWNYLFENKVIPMKANRKRLNFASLYIKDFGYKR